MRCLDITKNAENYLKEAQFYHVLHEHDIIVCDLCPHACRIMPGKTGMCKVRKNVDGTLYALSYGLISSMALDPIEKKPLMLFHTGKMILSVGQVGCNFACPFCQNSDISMGTTYDVHTIPITSKQLVEKAVSLKSKNNIGIAFTYNEPFISYEFLYDTLILSRETGLLNVLVTNGYISKEPLLKILPYVDALNIDLKSYSDGFYKNTIKGDLSSVKETIRICSKYCHVEITTLVIPGKNDSNEEIEALCKFIASISPEIPLHLTRFFPRYLWEDIMPTPVERLYELSTIASKYLRHIFIGNV